jgi:hypothetical protein
MHAVAVKVLSTAQEVSKFVFAISGGYPEKANVFSLDCQLYDYKRQGHRALCRGPEVNRKIHIILRDLFVAEREWLCNMSRPERENLFHDDWHDDPLNHLFISGEVALVLARGTSCAVLFDSNMCTSAFSYEYYTCVLAPWSERHEEFLREQGFRVDLITHALYLADRPKRPGMASRGDLLDLFFGSDNGVALFSDTRSPHNELIDKVFLKKRSDKLKEWTEDERQVTWTDFAKCTSFPASTQALDPTEGSTVFYSFEFPNQVYGSADVCCTPALRVRYMVDERDAVSLGEHYRKCRDAMASIGFPLEFDFKRPQNWSDSAIAKAIWAAAEEDIETIEDWRENSFPFRLRVPHDRFDRIMDRIYELEEFEAGDVELVMR